MKDSQKKSLKNHLGNTFGKFSSKGSFWHWILYSHDNFRLDGYDQGALENSDGIFDRLRKRFFDKILLGRHQETQNLYADWTSHGQVYLRQNINLNGHGEDLLIFSFKIKDAKTTTGKKYREITFSHNTKLEKFSKDEYEKSESLFGNVELAMKKLYIDYENSENPLDSLKQQLNGKTKNLQNISVNPQKQENKNTQEQKNSQNEVYILKKDNEFLRKENSLLRQRIKDLEDIITLLKSNKSS
jgi:hypothetical protein